MKDFIMARSERRGAIVGSTSSTPPEGYTTAVRSTKVFLATDIVPEVGAVVEASPHDLFDVPMLGSTFFICACRSPRKVATMEVVM